MRCSCDGGYIFDDGERWMCSCPDREEQERLSALPKEKD